MIKETNAKILYDTDTDTYSFKLSSPLSVCWQVTRKCNLNCLYCLSSLGINAEYGLNTEQAIKLIDGLGKIGINRLDFTGGEPLMRDDLWLLIDRAKQNNINTIVTTNTLLLNEKNIEVLKKADLVQISIDGYAKVKRNELTTDEKEMMTLVEKGMALKEFEYVGNIPKYAKENKLKEVEQCDLSMNVMPNMYKFKRIVTKGMKLGIIFKIICKILPKAFVGNAISGYLMAEKIEKGLFCYVEHIYEK